MLNIWTNPSVQQLLPCDPVQEITRRAREIVFEAIQTGWSGPPYDPFELARLRGVRTRPVSGIRDARTVPVGTGKFVIEYNASAPESRIRFSICHEIAHTLFPDCSETVRNRNSWHADRRDAWQLETLCNIAAAELLMPIGSFQEIVSQDASVAHLANLRKRFGASTEALLLRFARLTDVPCMAFVAHLDTRGVTLEYCVPSRTCPATPRPGIKLTAGTVLEQAADSKLPLKNQEVWPTVGNVSVECLRLVSHTNDSRARIAGLAVVTAGKGLQGSIRFAVGDATKPYGSGKKIIAHIVNDRSPIWGAGFGLAVRRKWPAVQADFKERVLSNPREFRLGAILSSVVKDQLLIVHMVAQHGFGKSRTPRIRYGALQSCLEQLAHLAERENAAVHMPRIGCGEAGGSWPIIQELIEQTLIRNVHVSVYDLPGKPFAGPRQPSLFEEKSWHV